MTIPGLFVVDTILLECHSLVFAYENISTTVESTIIAPTSSNLDRPAKGGRRPRIRCFTTPSNLRAELALPKLVHLEQARAVDIEILPGWNEITKGEIRIRSATAGLRLRTGDCKVLDELALEIRDKSKPGVIAFGPITPHNSIKIRIPYGSESDLNELAVSLSGDELVAATDGFTGET